MTAPPHPGRINYRVIAVVLVVAIPALFVGTAIVMGIAQSQLRESYGRQLTQTAERTAAVADAYVFRRIIDVAILARVPAIREEAAAASSSPMDLEAVHQLDEQWQLESAPPPSLVGLYQNPSSRFLREVTAADPIYSEVLLTDRQGALVAASGVTSDYYQGDEPWWQETAGTGQVSIGDVQWDESARVFAIDIAMPVLDPADDSFVGVLKVVADSRELFAAIGGMQAAEGAEPVLLRTDGSIVFSRQSTDPDTEFYAVELLREQLQTVQPGDPDYRLFFRAQSRAGRAQLVAIASTQLGQSYSNLSWLVAVSALEAEAFAPVRAQVIVSNPGAHGGSQMMLDNRTHVAALAAVAGLIVGVQATVGSRSVEAMRQAGDGRQVISPDNYPYFGLPYSPGILTGNTLYVAGHLGRDPESTELVSGGVEAETRQSLANIREVLQTAGMDFENVVSVTAYISDIREFATFNEVYREYFPEDPPARATVEVAALNVGARIELQMIAVR